MGTRIDNVSEYLFEVAHFLNGGNQGGTIVGATTGGSIYTTRYKFNTSNINNGCGSTSLYFAFASGTPDGVTREVETDEIIAVLTTNADAYKNCYGDDISDALAKVSLTRQGGTEDDSEYFLGLNYGFDCTIEYNFMPNTTYYIFVVPKKIGVGLAWAHTNYRRLIMGDGVPSYTDICDGTQFNRFLLCVEHNGKFIRLMPHIHDGISWNRYIKRSGLKDISVTIDDGILSITQDNNINTAVDNGILVTQSNNISAVVHEDVLMVT